MGFLNKIKNSQSYYVTENVPCAKCKNSNLFSFVKLAQLIVVLDFIFELTLVNCNEQQKQQRRNLFSPVTSTQYDYYFDKFPAETVVHDEWNRLTSAKLISLSKPTPPLNQEQIASFSQINGQYKRRGRKNRELNQVGPNSLSQNEYGLNRYPSEEAFDRIDISPAKVLQARYYTFGSANGGANAGLFSPIFNFQQLQQQSLIPNFEPAPFNKYQSSSKQINRRDAAQLTAQNLVDTSNAFDIIEPGSGFGPGGGWDSQAYDDTTNIMDDSTSLIDQLKPTNPANLLPTPVLSSSSFDQLATPTSSNLMGDRYNRPPTLNRRFPKLSVTAGQVWKYFIPFDTFIDEDGDLRQLKSSLYFRRPANYGATKQQTDNSNKPDMSLDSVNSRDSVGQFYSWLQYDQSSQLLYGLPTENEAGRHELVLVVSDRWGASSEELIEIYVRQHQSTRAFTHLFVINQIVWDRLRFPSIVDALGEYVMRISAQVYHDSAFKNFILQYYTVNSNINNQESTNLLNPSGSSTPTESNKDIDFQNGQSNTTMSFTIAWSNGSIPVHPCNISQIENLSKFLIDLQAAGTTSAGDEWSLEKNTKLLDLTPSQSLIRASGYEFKPSSVSIHLQGACERSDNSGLDDNNLQNTLSTSLSSSGNSDTPLRVRIKIGKLTWRLGEPIEYRIPRETFKTDGVAFSTRDLHLTLHTIDGLVFAKDPRYSFLEFDQESQTLYGLPYDESDHAGQKEIQLTARHPKSGYKVREVFILNIEPHELTIINNRAFRMSLYLAARSGLFGPRERVSLGHKIVAALRAGNQEFYSNRENPDFIVMDVRKFAITSASSREGSIGTSDIFVSNNYQDRIIRVADGDADQADDLHKLSRDSNSFHKESSTNLGNYFYKYTWTNGTIGYRGDCPVEVIKENILYALEQSMLELKFPEATLIEESSKNDSVRFYDRLRAYFEPDSDLIHLRFEPMGACMSALELHDVGNSDIADYADRAGEVPFEAEEISTALNSSPTTPRPINDTSNEEYWSIVVLIILVVVLIFVIIMFVMGMHTYKINQDKRFELQVKLAQARQNSMYLSSIMLANQAAPNDMCMLAPTNEVTKSIYIVQEEERGSRKPVILDNEKQLLTSFQRGSPSLVGLKSTAVQLSGQNIHTMPLKPNMTFTLDSSTMQPSQLNTVNLSPSTMVNPYLEDKHRSMTLNRKQPTSNQFNNQQQRFSGQFTNNNIQHSQSILTVASLATPLPIIHQGRLPY